jgi:hypothetical protein
MKLKRHRSRYWLLFLLMISVVLAFAASGCMWGVVTNARTGAPVANAHVDIVDSNGNVSYAFTDENGIYYIDAAKAPALGEATITVDSFDQGSQTENRVIDYAENPNATLANPVSFWEVQTFQLSGEEGAYHNMAHGYSLQFPQGWIKTNLVYDPESGVAPGIMAMGFDASHNMDICEIEWVLLPPGGFPEDWWRDAPPDMKVTQRGTAQIAGMTAARLAITLKMEGEDAKGLLYAVEHGQEGILLVCFTQSSGFSTAASTFESIAKSLKFD